MSTPTTSERSAVAAELKINGQFLYQCLTGRRAMEPKQAVRVERHTGGRIRRWQLRQADWFDVWPELIGIEGSPPIPAQQSQQAA